MKDITQQNQTDPKERRIDLHTHTTNSDGSMTSCELVRHAKESGLAAVAVSDHDSTSGVGEAVEEGRRCGIEVIPAIELSCKADTETHILGYFIDPTAPILAEKLREIREIRVERLVENCKKLQNLGYDVTIEEVKAKAAGGILCRAHIAKIMTEKGYCATPKEAFARWLNPGCPAHSDAQALSDEEAIALIRAAGGDAYLAHLHLTKKEGDALDAFVHRLKDAGLCGIEGYYTDYTEEMNHTYRALAANYGLKLSGGTDFHGAFKPHIQIGRGLGNLAIPYSVLENMKAR